MTISPIVLIAVPADTLERLADLVRCLTPGELFDAERQHIEQQLRRLAQEARAA
jgi:hypothetical protein